MAAGDYNVADRKEFLTAGGRVAETIQETPDADTEAFRTTTGTNERSAAFVNYATALEAHADRVDIESLDSRVRRDTGIAGAAFANQDHMRTEPSTTAPTAGSVRGVAPLVAGETPTGEVAPDQGA